MSNRRRLRRVHRPLRLERSLAVIFALLGTLATGLLTLHWVLVLEPTLRADAQSHSRLLAQAQAHGIEQRLASGDPARLRQDLEAALGGLLLVREQSSDWPFIQRITIELDYELVDAPTGSLDLNLGPIDCPQCVASPVPLYRPADRQLIGIATLYTSPEALQTLIGGFRLKLLLAGGFLLCLIGLAWLGTGRLLKRLTRSEANLRALFEAAPFPMVLREEGDPGLSRANRAAMGYLGLRETPAGGLTSPTWQALLEAGLPTHSDQHRERLIHSEGGKECWALVSAIPLRLSGGPGHLVSLVDISQLKAYQTELHLASITDGLTGLFNRRYLFLKLSESIKRAAQGHTPFCVLLFDLDHFKRVNDTFGHGVGDEVLVQAARALRACIRGRDLAGRYGGEEFLVILPDTLLPEALEVAERIRSAIKALSWPDLDLRMSLSGGVCEYSGTGIEALLECADRRLYAAKARGRDQVIAEDPRQPPSEGPS